MQPSARVRAAAVWCAATAGYAFLTCVHTWPLALHLRTHVLGDPSEDLGVYLWNLWIFRHELLRHAHLPVSTEHMFAYTGGADFSLHNYTAIAGALGAPLIGPLGLVGAFNVILLALITLSGLGMFLLARRLGLGAAAAWYAGAVFMASPVLTARETAHFSLVIAASLPLFLWALLRTLEMGRIRDAVLVGAVVAAASYSDAYYGIYCAIMGIVVVGWRFSRVEWPRTVTAWPRLASALNRAIAITCAFIAWRILSGTTRLTIGPVVIGLRTLYTPLLVLVLMVALRAWLLWRPFLRLDDPDKRLPVLLRLGLIAVGVCLVLQSPQLVGIALRILGDRLPETDIHWRSSPRGLDLLSYVVPNPNHPWFGDRTRQWFMPNHPEAFPEFVGSFSIASFAVIAMGAWQRLLPRFWLVFTGCFVLLSLGPFVHVAGFNTMVIGPWALLRYVPVVGMARVPSRFAIVAVLGMSLLFAFALEKLYRRPRTRGLLAFLVVMLAIELLPAPRRLYSAEVPDVYHLIAATEDESRRLLELPTGIRDGTSSVGDFNTATAYFQTTHRRPLIGGYLSRVSRQRKMENGRSPMLRTLFALSEGQTLSPASLDEARRSRDAFLARACLEFVVVNKRRASLALQAFAVEALRLKLVHEDPTYVLLTPADHPPCNPRPQGGRRQFTSVGQITR